MGYLVTTPLYPVDAMDSAAQGAPDTPSGALMPTAWVDAPALTAPLWPMASIVQTYFPHPYADAEHVAQTAPDLPTGSLGPTYFPHRYADAEHVAQTAPDLPTGFLGAEYFPLPSSAWPEDALQGAPDIPTGTLT